MEQSALEQREDLFRKWVVQSWFSASARNQRDFEMELHEVWLTLFSNLYDDLSERLPNREACDALFLEFSNSIFPAALDTYKWYASEKLGGDIGLLAALAQITGEAWFIELLSSFSQTY
ncbi:MAG: hypothetical protein LBC99_03455 [Spirochaetota bacterium]|jgi:hypothetical protein|nr:hypothetical protein [Spirochaetota bacterium]